MLVNHTRGRRLLFAGPCRFWDGDAGGAGGDGGSGGAMPPAANPPANPPANPDDPQLGDAGKLAIQRERDARAAEKKRADEAERQLKELQDAGASESEKALKAAREEATKAERVRLEGTIRRSEARSALRAAGITNDKDLELAASAPQFASLAIEEDGSVKDLAATVDAFKKDHPSLFTPAAPAGGGVTRGPQGGTNPERPKTLSDAVAAAYAKH